MSASIDELSKLAQPGANAIALQLTLASKTPSDAMSDPWALGYCFGAFESLRLHGGFDQHDGFGMITLGFVLLLGRDEAPEHIRRALKLQADKDFTQGADAGGSDMTDWIGPDDSNPLALMNHFSFGPPARRTDLVDVLLRQAADLNWVQTATVKEDGYGAAWTKRSVRFARENEEAVVWYKDATITLVRDYAPPTFDDFVQVEKWIKENPRDNEVDTATGERLYLREIERFVIRHGHFESMLEAQATDKEFFIAVAKFHKAGYVTKESSAVVAALTLDALLRYKKDRKHSLEFLARTQNDFGRTATL